MKRIVVAFSSSVIAEELHSRLSGSFDVQLCRDGADTMACIAQYKPDVLVLDLMLCGMDSIQILWVTRDTNPDCKMIVTSTYFSEYILSQLEDIRVQYACKTPSDCRAFAARIMDVALWQPEDRGIARDIRNLMMNIGFAIHTESCRITETAIRVFYNNPAMPLTAELYPAVAKLCGTGEAWVERAIRMSVENSWKNCDPNIWRLYFGTDKKGRVIRPSNKEFLARMVYVLQSKEQEQSFGNLRIG